MRRLPRPLKLMLETVFAVLSIAFALLLALTVGVVVLTSSSWGLQLIFRAAPLAGVQISAGTLHGSLFGPIVLEGVTVRMDDGTRVDVGRLELKLDPGALWIGELRIARFDAHDLRLTPAEAAPGTAARPEAPLTLPLRLVVDEASTDRFQILRADGAVQASFPDVHLQASWSGNHLHIVDARAGVENYGPVRVSGDAQLFRHSLRGDRLAVTSAVSGVVSGTYQYADTIPSQLHAHISDVESYLRGTPVSHASGDVDVTGRLGSYRFDTRLRALVQKVAIEGSAHGSGSLQGLHFDALELHGAPGAVLASGELDWHGGMAGDLRAQLRHLDLQAFVPGEKSDLNGEATARSSGAGAARDIAFTTQLDHSSLRGFAFGLSAEGHWADHRLTLTTLRADSAGHTHVQASGTVLPAVQLQAQLDSNDVGALWPGIGGATFLSATVAGAAGGDWHVVSSGHLEGGRGYGLSVQHLAWDIDVDWQQAWHVSARADGLDAGIPVQHAQVRIDGPLGHQAVTLALHDARGDAHIEATGALDLAHQAWDGSLTALRLDAPPLAPVSLQAPVHLALSAQRVALEQACLAGDAGRLCLAASWLAGSVKASWSVPGFSLGVLGPLLPAGWTVQGDLQGAGELGMTGAALEDLKGHLQATLTKLQLPGAPALHGVAAEVDVEPQQGSGLLAHVSFKLPQGELNGDVRSSIGGAFATRPIAGTVSAQLKDLSWVSALFPEMERVHGTFSAQATLGGTLGTPSVTGEGDLQDAQLSLAAPGITLKQMQVKLHGDGSGVVHLGGRAVSDTGTLAVDGQINLADSPVSLDLHFTGANVQALDHADARIWVSPDLHLLRDQEALRLTGTLGVPHAEITPKGGLSSGAQPVSQDQILLGRNAQTRSETLPVRAQVTIALGSEVHFKGFGLTSRLEGSVTVSENPGQETHGTGELRLLDGRYKAYGQDLKIDAGRLIFTGGEITSPAVDIRASKQPTPQVTVGVHVRGTLAAPEFALESDPVMSREDQLGWLLLGQPLSQSSSEQKTAIQSAALSLGVMGSSWLGAGLIQKLGLNLSVSSENTESVTEYQAAGSAYGAPQPTLANGQALPQATAQSPQVTLGKYLSPRLFVSYGVSVFQPGQTVNLQYDIGHGFKVQTETGTASGGDILYTVEKGK